MAQRQNNTVRHFGSVRHFGTEGHFGTATKWHGESLWHSVKMTRCFIDKAIILLNNNKKFDY